jgi:ethanolamine utilization microcompartment shell protein EutL
MAETTREPAAIRAGIERARQEIEQSMNDLRANVSQTLSWRAFVSRHPIAVFSGAFLLGLVVARATSRP